MQQSLTDARAIVQADLDHICQTLDRELGQIAGKQLLITGGAGFLGYYLVQAVAHWNRQAPSASRITLAVYDNFKRGTPDWLGACTRDPLIAVRTHDMSTALPADMPAFEYIIHAAGIASPVYYRRFPLETIDANINGLRNLLEYARGRADGPSPVEGLLFYSSSEIYGDPAPEAIPTAEEYRGLVSCTGPRACYDESKRFGETLCVVFAEQYGVEVKMARPFNNYGPGLKISDGRVIPDFARDILAGRDIVLRSDGTPTRTFCYSADAVTGYYKVLVRGRRGEPYNIGVEAPEISMRDLAQLMVDTARDLFDYPGRLVLPDQVDTAYLVDNPTRRCPDIRKARSELDYAPIIGIEEGVRRSLLWYRDHATAEDA